MTAKEMPAAAGDMASSFNGSWFNLLGNHVKHYSNLMICDADEINMGSALPSPAKDFGWHDPGYIHSAVMTGLEPSNTFSYGYGRF
ncbi:hypothetical protein FH972_010849 [Carpinus fangiana]|uniref:Uncharacterized protein n=1 Tax=Carpinus fangiana TaxID=176857 RepID=A0A660KWH5_9ROSI|nr:hypothetical protein FH972_010849 [Carpinus fangiana]